VRYNHFAIAFTAILALTMSACSPFYVARAGYEEAKILSRRKPIEKVIADPRTDAETRRKLQLVLQARTFSHSSLGLAAAKNYTSFSQLDSDTLALVLSASPDDRLAAYTWWFPIVGRVPYKGYFSLKSAEKAAAKLEAKGYDTYIRPTSAFSTLGWFSDPVLSTMLDYDDVGLFSTIVHELTHSTLFIPSQVAFNESFANFVGDRGAVDYFCDLEGETGQRCRAARAQWRNDLLFSRYLGILIPDLEAVYARTDLSHEERLRLREEVYARNQENFLEEFGEDLSPGYQRLIERPLNNARLVAVRLYYHRLDLFEAALQRHDQDLPAAIQAITDAVRGSKDPYSVLAHLAGLTD
jgi:predicted aminopeptidase